MTDEERRLSEAARLVASNPGDPGAWEALERAASVPLVSDRLAYGEALARAMAAIQAGDRPAALACAREALALDRRVRPHRVDECAGRLVDRWTARIEREGPG